MKYRKCPNKPAVPNNRAADWYWFVFVEKKKKKKKKIEQRIRTRN